MPVPPPPAPDTSSVTESHEDEIHFKKGANWISENVKTLMLWIHISAIYIDILGESTKLYKRTLRTSTIINLILSSVASTITVTQYSEITKNYPVLDWLIKGLIMLSTVIITLNAGYLKVYNIQEKVEKSIRLQQQWIEFGTALSSELQLPVEHRKDALYFIIRMKDTYSTLIKQHIVANRSILKKIAFKNGVEADILTLSDLLERSIQAETGRIEEDAARIRSSKLASVLREAGAVVPRRTSKLGETTTAAAAVSPKRNKFVPSAAKLLQAKNLLKHVPSFSEQERGPVTKPSKVNVLSSPRSSISNYLFAAPTAPRTESPPTPLSPIEEESDTDNESVVLNMDIGLGAPSSSASKRNIEV